MQAGFKPQGALQAPGEQPVEHAEVHVFRDRSTLFVVFGMFICRLCVGYSVDHRCGLRMNVTVVLVGL